MRHGKFNHHRLFCLECLFQGGHNLFLADDPHSNGAVRLGDLDKVRYIGRARHIFTVANLGAMQVSSQTGRGVAPLVEQLLPLPYHAEVLIVENQHLYR